MHPQYTQYRRKQPCRQTFRDNLFVMKNGVPFTLTFHIATNQIGRLGFKTVHHIVYMSNVQYGIQFCIVVYNIRYNVYYNMNMNNDAYILIAELYSSRLPPSNYLYLHYRLINFFLESVFRP